MSDVALNMIVNSWRDQEFFEGLDDSMKQRIPASPVGPINASPRPRNADAVGSITLLNDDCNMTMVGPDGCYV
jgi:mersacidin/lichenicidin family type 2 lantibiotic